MGVSLVPLCKSASESAFQGISPCFCVYVLLELPADTKTYGNFKTLFLSFGIHYLFVLLKYWGIMS
jgi:hypothetical protein